MISNKVCSFIHASLYRAQKLRQAKHNETMTENPQKETNICLVFTSRIHYGKRKVKEIMILNTINQE